MIKIWDFEMQLINTDESNNTFSDIMALKSQQK